MEVGLKEVRWSPLREYVNILGDGRKRVARSVESLVRDILGVEGSKSGIR